MFSISMSSWQYGYWLLPDIVLEWSNGQDCLAYMLVYIGLYTIVVYSTVQYIIRLSNRGFRSSSTSTSIPFQWSQIVVICHFLMVMTWMGRLSPLLVCRIMFSYIKVAADILDINEIRKKLIIYMRINFMTSNVFVWKWHNMQNWKPFPYSVDSGTWQPGAAKSPMKHIINPIHS